MSRTELRQRLAAILAADVAGYSRLMAADDRGTVAALDAARAVFRDHIETHHGRVIDMAGDSILAVFETVTGAVSSALAVQKALKPCAGNTPEDRHMKFRIGVHMGEVIEKPDGTIYGDGVNIASRLEGLAPPGGIAISDVVRGEVKNRLEADFADLGEQTVKNRPDPVHAFAVTSGEGNSIVGVTGIDLSSPVEGFGGRPAIAVLPFDNLSRDPEQEYFADGLAEEILTRLAMWRWVPVISRNSSFAYKGRAVDMKEVGRALGARYVLEGSVRKAGNRVRVTGQLIDAETGHHIWAERYDRVLADLFAIQDELTDGIVGALEAAVGRAESERAHRKPPNNLDAWDICQKGFWHFSRFRREDFAAAVPLFMRASRLDPGFTQPHWGIASVRICEALFLWTSKPTETFAEAAASARAALAIDAMDPFAHSVLGCALVFAGKHDDALVMARRGVELNPSSTLGYPILGVTHMFRGEAAPGIQAIETAIRISPNDTLLQIWLATLSGLHYLSGDYPKAVSVARQAVQRAPHFPIGWRALANSLGQLGQLDEARAALAQFLALMPGYTTEEAARRSVGYRDEAIFQHHLAGLRKAGWTG